MRVARPGRDAVAVSEFVALIDSWKDAHGQPSDSSIARAIGVRPQTISSWRTRGIRELPEQDTLTRLAGFLGVDLERVLLPAVLRDAGYLPKRRPDDPDGEEPTSQEAG